MKMFKKILAPVVISAGMLANPVIAAETVTVIKPTPRSAVFFPLVVGEALGYFEEEGVSVKLLPSDTSIPYVAFVQNGQADLAMLDANETYNAVIAGAGINTVYEAMQNAPEGIAVLSSSGIGSMSELVGTTVGLVSDRDLAFLQAAMDISGHSINDISTVVLGESGPVLAKALRDGDVSAISGSVFDWAGLQAAGIDLSLITPDALLASPANTFAMNAELVEAKRPVMEGFFRAWSKGMYVAIDNPDVVEAMLRSAVPEEWEDEAAGKSLLEGVLPMNISTTPLLGDLEHDVWKGLQPRMISSGAIDREVDVNSFLNNAYIGVANDFNRSEVDSEVCAWRAKNM